MLAKIIADILEVEINELTLGVNLFIEKSKGQCVAISVPDTYDFNINNSLRKSYCTVGVIGYPMVEGKELAERIVEIMANLKGEYSYNSKTYNLLGVKIKRYPYFVVQDDRDIYYFGATISYNIK